MGRSLQRLIQINKPDRYNDQEDAFDIANSEIISVDLEDFTDAFLSQIKRIIHGNRSGNWYDDPVTIFGSDASLYALLMGGGGDDDQVKGLVPEGETFLVKENHQHITWNKFIIEGEYKIDGISVVLD